MSQRSEKLRRRVDTLEARMDAVELGKVWDAAEASVHNQAALDAATERNAERRRARKAERAVVAWRRMTYAVLVAAIIVLVAAILVVYARADDTPSNELMISGAETVTHPENTAKNDPIFVMSLSQTDASDKVAEDFENERIEAALLARANVIEGVIVTHYDCCVQCCGKDDGITASGRKATPGVTVAVDPNVIPLGSDVLVDYGDGEIHYYRSDDVGGSVKGNHIDLCVATHEEALQLGRRTATVYWVAPEEVA